MFDMDNTLLASKIDFPKMKLRCLNLLQDYQVDGWQELGGHATASEMIELAKERGKNDIVKEMFTLIEGIEKEGMKEALLEPGALEVVQHLAKEKTLVIVTNNATTAAIYALERLNIASYFTDIYGRDRLLAMKPAPDSLRSVLARYPQLKRDEWVMVGDSWIDGQAAKTVGIPYICYNGSRRSHEEKQIPMLAHIKTLQQLL